MGFWVRKRAGGWPSFPEVGVGPQGHLECPGSCPFAFHISPGPYIELGGSWLCRGTELRSPESTQCQADQFLSSMSLCVMNAWEMDREENKKVTVSFQVSHSTFAFLHPMVPVKHSSVTLVTHTSPVSPQCRFPQNGYELSPQAEGQWCRWWLSAVTTLHDQKLMALSNFFPMSSYFLGTDPRVGLLE